MTIDIEINRQDYADFNKHHFKKTGLSKTILTGVLTIVVLEVYLNRKEFNLLATAISASACALIYYFLIARRLQSTRNIPKDDGTILGKKSLTFTEHEITCKAPDSSSEFKWTSIKSIEEGKTAVYLYLDSNMAILLPKRNFMNESQRKELFELVKDKIKRS